MFADKIYVYTTSGDIMELPRYSTPIYFAYKIHTDIGNTMAAAIVNNKYVPIDYELQNKDRGEIITDILSFDSRGLDKKVQTSIARRKNKRV